MFGLRGRSRPSALEEQLRSLLRHLADRGFETRELIFERPASLGEVVRVEETLGFVLPPACREVFLSVSKHVGFWWYAPDDVKFPSPFQGNFSGHLEWDLDALPNSTAQGGLKNLKIDER